MLEVVGEGVGVVCVHVFDDARFGCFVLGSVCHFVFGTGSGIPRVVVDFITSSSCEGVEMPKLLWSFRLTSDLGTEHQ